MKANNFTVGDYTNVEVSDPMELIYTNKNVRIKLRQGVALLMNTQTLGKVVLTPINNAHTAISQCSRRDSKNRGTHTMYFYVQKIIYWRFSYDLD